MMTPHDRLEYTATGERLLDFCLWEYPSVAPLENKLRSANLLFRSFEIAGAGEVGCDLVRALREAIGMSQTVFGVKWVGDVLRWEFYFYDYRRRERTRCVARIVKALGPLVRCDLEVNESLPYFMFSIDVEPALLSGAASLDEIHMYVGTPGSTVSGGICYSVTKSGTTLENLYFFFDARRQLGEIKDKASCSAYVDSARIPIDAILWPELQKCKVIVVANKKHNDAVYFAGIDTDQFLFFLKRMGYPAPLVSFVEANRSRLDHMLYDVGIDYRMEGKELVFLKSAYFGVF